MGNWQAGEEYLSASSLLYMGPMNLEGDWNAVETLQPSGNESQPRRGPAALCSKEFVTSMEERLGIPPGSFGSTTT